MHAPVPVRPARARVKGFSTQTVRRPEKSGYPGTTVVSATYDPVLSRVRVSAVGGIGWSGVTYLTVERSTDGITWATVRGGASVAVTGFSTIRPIDDYEFTDSTLTTYRVRAYNVWGELQDTGTATITPALGSVWLKFIAAPYLNREVMLTGWSDISRSSRTGVFPVAARREPVVVTDLHSTRAVTIELYTQSIAESLDLDLVMSLGAIAYLHVPISCPLPTMYAAVGDYSYVRSSTRSLRSKFTVPLTEVAKPAASVVGSAATWTTVLNNYATWQDVLDGNATWLTVADLVGSGTDIIVTV